MRVETRERVLWGVTLTALALAVFSVFRDAPAPQSPDLKASTGSQAAATPTTPNPDTAGVTVTEDPVSGLRVIEKTVSVRDRQSGSKGDSVPFRDLSEEEQERVIEEQLDITRKRFDDAFDRDEPETRSDWSFNKEAEFSQYMQEVDGTVHDARCNEALCRASLEFSSEEEAERFFSHDERSQNPWATGRLKAVRDEANSQRRVTIYAIPDKSRRANWGVDELN